MAQFVSVMTASAQLSLALVNNFTGSYALNAYVTGVDTDGNWVLLQSDGTWYHPLPGGKSGIPERITADIAIPIGQKGNTTKIDLSGYISSGRIWVAVGSLSFSTVIDDSGTITLIQPSILDPPNRTATWGFAELTYSERNGLFVNLSYVDFVGLALGISVESADGTIQRVHGLSPGAMASICSQLKQSSTSDQPWSELCETDHTNRIRRIVSPSTYISSNPMAFQGYYTSYVQSVWTQYSNRGLTINTQGPAGYVQCTTSGDVLTCDGDNRDYKMPTTADIFSCSSGPFLIQAGDNDIHQAVVPRLCAAFQRTVLSVEGGDVQPNVNSNLYYRTSPTNYYSKLVHDYEPDRKGYAFPYDDVNPTGEDESGIIASTSPKLLTVTVNGL